MGKELRIRLGGFDLGQALDGLRCRRESWERTAIYLRDGYFPDDAFVCEECSDPEEAQRIAEHYDRIIRNIEAQVDQQGCWRAGKAGQPGLTARRCDGTSSAL